MVGILPTSNPERRWRVRAVLRHAGADHDLALAFGRAQRARPWCSPGANACRQPTARRRRGSSSTSRPRRRRSPRPRPASACALNAAVERRIAALDLAQYQWTYKRYTLRPSGTRRGQPTATSSAGGGRSSKGLPGRRRRNHASRRPRESRLRPPAGSAHIAASCASSRCQRCKGRLHGEIGTARGTVRDHRRIQPGLVEQARQCLHRRVRIARFR